MFLLVFRSARFAAIVLAMSAVTAGSVAAQPGATTAPPIRYRPAALSLDAGWGAPTGWGLTYSHMLGQQFDWTLGGGLAISGAKLGVGVRYYVAPERRVSPWFGTALVRSGGMSDLEVDSDADADDDFDWFNTPDASRTYSIRANWQLHARSGLRWQPGRVGFLGALGYGFCLSDDPFRFPDAMPRADRRLARVLGPGGVEVSMSIVVGLGR